MTLKEQLKRDEGWRATAYQDSRGVWTVGYGHNLSVALSDAAMEQILDDDLAAALAACRTLPEYDVLTEPRQGVLTNMMFNLGPSRYRTFVQFRRALRAGDYVGAAREMLDSEWAQQVGARADRLAQQMRTSEWV